MMMVFDQTCLCTEFMLNFVVLLNKFDGKRYFFAFFLCKRSYKDNFDDDGLTGFKHRL